MININNLKKLGSGSASDAYLLEGNKVLVVGKREDSYFNYEKLVQKSNMINGKITTIKYPKIDKLIKPCQEYPFGAIIEDYIPGFELKDKIKDLTEDDKRLLGENLAVFLTELHSIKAEMNCDEEININLKKFDRSIEILRDYVNYETLEKLQIIKKEYHELMQSKKFCITHGDLNAGNIMITHDNKLSGLIDFGNMEYYIPEVEFVHMYFFDKTIYDAMIKNYDKKIEEKEMLLLELVINIRHFKNIVNFETKRNNCLNNINTFMNQYLNS